MSTASLMWFRGDLRVTDNPALFAAMAAGQTSAVFFWCDEQWRDHDLSPARLQLTRLALLDLNQSLAKLGVTLTVIRVPDFKQVPNALNSYIDANNITDVYVNAEYALNERRRDRAVKAMCRDQAVHWHPYHGTIMQMPGTLKTGQGQPYKVFTPFKRAWYGALPEAGRSLKAVPSPQGQITPVALDLPDIQCEIDTDVFPTTEQASLDLLAEFARQRISEYKDQRDLPAVEGTSRLSAALAVGMLSPFQCYYAALHQAEGDLASNPGADTWVSELIWREFYLNVIYSWPAVCKGEAFRPEMDAVAWRYDQKDFELWCRGETGFPIVDAAMKQLNQTGWMHNRLRMVTAMFLSKYLLIDWRWGEQYFMQHLIDGHFAANNGGWQWSASTGTDAAPYFRLLSPIRQGERFDPQGDFIRHYLPELKQVSAKALHKPGSPELLAAGYPAPMIDLKVTREACLTAFKAVKAG